MTQFIQLHVLTSYPPSNLNRDDMGRPKTALMGNVERLRISSQSLKRHWRISDVFEQAIAGYQGTRTKLIGQVAYDKLLAGGINEKNAEKIAKKIIQYFGTESKGKLQTSELVHISHAEQQAIDHLIEDVIKNKKIDINEEDLALLTKENMAVDIALFGRMLASKPTFDVEAACQVAHAISVQQVTVEEDYFTAVDDLKNKNSGDDSGAAHLGETNFASAVFYQYICINCDLLVENLNGNVLLAQKALAALLEAIATVSPSGKQNSFGSRAYASYIMAEKGTQQPRSLSVAFLKPINTITVLTDAIASLEKTRENMEKVYGRCADALTYFNVETGEGTLQALQEFVMDVTPNSTK